MLHVRVEGIAIADRSCTTAVQRLLERVLVVSKAVLRVWVQAPVEAECCRPAGWVALQQLALASDCARESCRDCDRATLACTDCTSTRTRPALRDNDARCTPPASSTHPRTSPSRALRRGPSALLRPRKGAAQPWQTMARRPTSRGRPSRQRCSESELQTSISQPSTSAAQRLRPARIRTTGMAGACSSRTARAGGEGPSRSSRRGEVGTTCVQLDLPLVMTATVAYELNENDLDVADALPAPAAEAQGRPLLVDQLSASARHPQR